MVTKYKCLEYTLMNYSQSNIQYHTLRRKGSISATYLEPLKGSIHS